MPLLPVLLFFFFPGEVWVPPVFALDKTAGEDTDADKGDGIDDGGGGEEIEVLESPTRGQLASVAELLEAVSSFREGEVLGVCLCVHTHTHTHT